MYSKENIVELLGNYRELRKNVKLLEFEAEHAPRKSVINALNKARTEIDRLEFYISLLDEKKASVLKLLYIDGLTWKETQQRLSISGNTLFRYRGDAIAELTEMCGRLPTS